MCRPPPGALHGAHGQRWIVGPVRAGVGCGGYTMRTPSRHQHDAPREPTPLPLGPRLLLLCLLAGLGWGLVHKPTLLGARRCCWRI